MDIAFQIARIQGLRNSLRDKLIGLGLLSNQSASLEDCVASLDNVIDNGAVSETLTIENTEYTIPLGLHNGNGKVDIVLEEKTATPSSSIQEITPSTGKVLSKVTIGAVGDGFANVSNVTATQLTVLANKIFVDSSGAELAGTMLNNGALSQAIDGLTVTSYTIPEGYHNGDGTVSLNDDIENALAAI